MTDIVCGWCGDSDCQMKCPEAQQVMAALTEGDAKYIGPIDD